MVHIYQLIGLVLSIENWQIFKICITDNVKVEFILKYFNKCFPYSFRFWTAGILKAS